MEAQDNRGWIATDRAEALVRLRLDRDKGDVLRGCHGGMIGSKRDVV
jgi:hypothetical protein